MVPFVVKNYLGAGESFIAQLSYIIECVHTHKRVLLISTELPETVFQCLRPAISDHKPVPYLRKYIYTFIYKYPD